MLLVHHNNYGVRFSPQRSFSLLEGHTAVLEALKEASKLEPQELIPLAIAIEDVAVHDEAVLYTFRVTCNTHGASWIMPPRRYTDFELLHKSIKSCESFDDELPSKFLLVPSRAALVQRAAGLQRYCNEIMCNPEALGCTGVAGFFELDQVRTQLEPHHSHHSCHEGPMPRSRQIGM